MYAEIRWGYFMFHFGVRLHVVGGCSDTFTASENILTVDISKDFTNLENFRSKKQYCFFL